ncbi:hypothetical protein EI555_013742, partial [Monodon monoceros]
RSSPRLWGELLWEHSQWEPHSPLLGTFSGDLAAPWTARPLSAAARIAPARLLATARYGAQRCPGPSRIKPVVRCDINCFHKGKIIYSTCKDYYTQIQPDGVKLRAGHDRREGVRKLFTMNGHLLDNSKDLQDNHFYVEAGLEAFQYFPYWKSPKVPREV